MTNRYRAGQPCILAMPIEFVGEEPATSTLENDYETYHVAFVKQHEPDLSLRDRFLSIFKKPWGLS